MNVNDKYMDLVSLRGKARYQLWKEGIHQTDPLWDSHQLVLINLLNTITSGNVLEFGMGHGSTELMHAICEQQGRNLVSIDSDEKWINKFHGLKSDSHRIEVFDPVRLIRGNYDYMAHHYSIIFVDAAPAGIRQPFIERMKPMAKYILVHDTELLANGRGPASYGYNFDSFKHVVHFTESQPTSTILSDLEEIDKNILL